MIKEHDERKVFKERYFMRSKEEIIIAIDEIIAIQPFRPMYPKDMGKELEIIEEESKVYDEAIMEMQESGKIFFTGKGKITTPEMMGIKIGVLQKRSGNFGFVILNEPGNKDVFIHRTKLNEAMNNDIVGVKITNSAKPGTRPEGEIVKIIKRDMREYVGTLIKDKNHMYVIPIDRKAEAMFIRPEDCMDAKVGDKVTVRFAGAGHTAKMPPYGKVTGIVGRKGEKGLDVLAILKEQGFGSEFNNETLDEAAKIKDSVEDQDIKGRRDLRGNTIFTIDGSDTKDIDDAVSIEILEDGKYRLSVHIADVSHYVKNGTELDKSARIQTTSVYPIDRVVPMLPPKLSNGICSLNPREDRLALSVSMDIDNEGNIVDHDIFKSVIRSCYKMTYDNVYKIVEEENEELCEEYKDIVKDLKTMKKLAIILRKKRFDRGAIDFNVPEAKVILDENDIPVKIARRELTIANYMIEEMMLACNETVAEHFFWLDIPFVYRIHEQPNKEKLDEFCVFARIMGYDIKIGPNSIHSLQLQSILQKARGKQEERVISTIMLRTMQKAKYTEKHSGHFGLGAKYYSHLTSPIRRYPDLMIHRIISEHLAGKLTDTQIEFYEKLLPTVTNHCSERERAAETAERESTKLKMAEYMKDHIGEEFICIVSGVANFGMFVETDDLIEGFVSMESLYDDYYIYNEREYALIGERTSKKFQIGDIVKATVVSVNLDERTIEFCIDMRYNDLKNRRKKSNKS